MQIAFFVVAAVPLLLLFYVWYLDRNEREPFDLMAKVFLASALLGTASAGILETIGQLLLQFTILGYIPIVRDIVFYFVVVAFVEEFCKRLPVMKLVWKSPNLNYRFDAIVYCVTVAIGFAVAENLMYVCAFGGSVMLGRLFPVHAICGVFMGYYMACAKIYQKSGDRDTCKRYLWMSLLVPMLIHGTWDVCVSASQWADPITATVLMYLAFIGLIVMTVVAFLRLRTYAKFDSPL